MKLRIPHDAWIVVCDGRKALFLRNEGNAAAPNLKVERTSEAPENPIAARQGTDRPGRSQNVVGPTSAVDQTDWHAQAEADFAAATARAIETLDRSEKCGLVLVAPPRTLAALREHIGHKLHASIIAEIDKEMTNHPVHEIARLLTAA